MNMPIPKLDAVMKAVMYHGPKEIRLQEVPIRLPGPGEALLRVGAALTCGTDFKAYRQGHEVLLGDLPAPFGHELTGTVVAVGPDITKFTTGMSVVAANSAPCHNEDRACFFCGRGQTQLCDNLKLHNGAYAEYNLVPANIVKHNLYPIPDNVTFEDAALSEPFACAIHAVDVLGIGKGERVAIIGAGIMSMLLLEALNACGAETVVVGRSPGPLERARELGARETVSVLKQNNVVAAVRKLHDGRGADCVIEAVGKPETWNQAVEMVRKGGKVCLFGGCSQGTRVPIDAHRIHYGQLSLYGVFHHTPKYFQEALRLLSSGDVTTGHLIESTIRLHEVPKYFERMHHRSNSKVAVIP